MVEVNDMTGAELEEGIRELDAAGTSEASLEIMVKLHLNTELNR